ncbi:FAD-binding domain-containing protein [Amylostereum chailletii]|nr:FAD-binding domain-containing protein [Amylostereum chailletii]
MSDTDPAAAAEAAHLHAIKHRGEFVYPIQVWYLELSALALATLINITCILWAKLYVRYGRKLASGDQAKGRASLWRLPAAVLTAWRVVAFRWRIPLGRTFTMSVFEVFITSIYMAALLIWEFVHTDNLNPDFWSNKAAHIAAAQLSLLPALSSKNSVIGWLTGVSHEKLNVLHRAAARCIYVLIWVHVWGRWRVGFTGVDYIPDFGWQQLGATSGIAYTLILLLSVRPMRKYCYEVFYFLHVLFVFVFPIVVYLHTTTPGFHYYIYPVWVVWGFERLVRLIRYVVINYLLKPKNAPFDATLSLVGSDALQITVTRRMPFGWRPGQHAFLAFPGVSTLPLESHPFTIASIPSRDLGAEQKLVFLVRAKGGATQRLLNLAQEHGDTQFRAYIDGPYGMPPDLGPYRTSVFVAGGTGVTYTLPLLLDLVQRASAGKALSKRIHFIWAVPSEERIEWISTALSDAIATAPPALSLDISIFVTRSSPSSSPPAVLEKDAVGPGRVTPESGDVDAKQSKAELGGLGVIPVKGRPDVRRLVAEEIARAEGPVSVDGMFALWYALIQVTDVALVLSVSGPVELVMDARAAVNSLNASLDVLRGGPTVHLHEENFTY